MDMDNAAAFLAGSILYAIGLVVILIAIVVVNNIISRYWKPVRIFTADSWSINPPMRYATDDEMAKIAPHMEKSNGQKETSKKV